MVTRNESRLTHGNITDITTVERHASRSSIGAADATLPAVGPIRIVIADEHMLVRDGLRVLLSGQPDLRVVGEAADGAEVLSVVRATQPDVLLLDASLQKKSEFDVLSELHAAHATVQTILLATTIEREAIVTALQLGGRGIFFKDNVADLLFKSIRRVHEGELWISHAAVAELVSVLADRHDAPEPETPGPARDFGLTARERDVLRLIVEGETNKGIAARLSVGPDTVKHHLTNIFNKTGASNRLELALFALHHRIVSAD